MNTDLLQELRAVFNRFRLEPGQDTTLALLSGIIIPLFLILFFHHAINFNGTSTFFWGWNYLYLLPGTVGNIYMASILLKSIQLDRPSTRNLRRTYFGILGILTLTSFSLYGFTSHDCMKHEIEEVRVASIAGLILFFNILFIACIYFLEHFHQNEAVRGPVITIYRLLLNINNGLLWAIHILENDLLASNNFNENRERISRIVKTFGSLMLITFVVSSIPFLLELFFNLILSRPKSFGGIVGLNDLYLIPAIFGAAEVSSTISSNRDTHLQLHTKIRRFTIGLLGMFSLVSFSLFAFGAYTCIISIQELDDRMVIIQSVFLWIVITILIAFSKLLEAI